LFNQIRTDHNLAKTRFFLNKKVEHFNSSVFKVKKQSKQLTVWRSLCIILTGKKWPSEAIFKLTRLLF